MTPTPDDALRCAEELLNTPIIVAAHGFGNDRGSFVIEDVATVAEAYTALRARTLLTEEERATVEFARTERKDITITRLLTTITRLTSPAPEANRPADQVEYARKIIAASHPGGMTETIARYRALFKTIYDMTKGFMAGPATDIANMIEESGVLATGHVKPVEPAPARVTELLYEALEFYADPNTWFATALMCDRPCGAIETDISSTEGWESLVSERPGKRARETLTEADRLTGRAK